MKNILLKAMLAFTSFGRLYPADAQSGTWTWISGSTALNVSSTASNPGNRDSQAYWKDAFGNFWIFGGEDYANAFYNDLWEYSPSNKQWTQVGANSSAPGIPVARYGAVGVADAQGNFWIFGGANGGNCYNDLWEYVLSSRTWNHVSGSTTPNAGSVYSGTLAVPGARCYSTTAIDGSGNIWLFGGQNLNKGDYNDLWEYSTVSGQWTFVNGTPNTTNSTGVYSGSSMAPGARFGHCLWIDAGQNIWVFGGQGYDNNAGDEAVFLNDLWEYSTGKWSWKGGNKSGDNSGVYGTLGNPAANNIPGARFGASGMEDVSGAFWVFGGIGYDASGAEGDWNDLWSYNPANNLWTWISGANAVDQSPVFGTQGLAGSANHPGALQNTSGWADGSGNIWIMGGSETYNNNDDYNDLWKFANAATLPFTALTLQVTSQGSGNYLAWQTIDELNTASYLIERSTDGVIFQEIGSRTAAGSGSNSYSFMDAAPCVPGNNFYRLTVLHTQGDSSFSTIAAIYNSEAVNLSVYPNPSSSGILLRCGTDVLLNTRANLYDASGRLVGQELITSREQYIDLHLLPAGLYLLQLTGGATIPIVRN